jgi:hypothetical protein
MDHQDEILTTLKCIDQKLGYILERMGGEPEQNETRAPGYLSRMHTPLEHRVEHIGGDYRIPPSSRPR